MGKGDSGKADSGKVGGLQRSGALPAVVAGTVVG